MGQVIGFKGVLNHKMEGGRVLPSQVVKGLHIFRVIAPSHRAPWIEEIRVCSDPTYRNSDGMSATACKIRDGVSQRFESYFSMLDAGIVPNNYNMHSAFHNREDAQNYIDRLAANELTAFEHQRFARVTANNRQQNGFY